MSYFSEDDNNYIDNVDTMPGVSLAIKAMKTLMSKKTF